MRLSTFVLASAFVWVVTPGSVVADGTAPGAGTPDAFGTMEAADPVEATEENMEVAQEGAEPMAPGEPIAPADQVVTEDSAPGVEGASEPPAPAESAPENTPPGDLSWDDFEDPSFDPAAPAASDAGRQVVSQQSSRSSSIPLGPMGVDENGVEGRIHTVSSGETLWDISEAYLGTPWVWPSVWDENQGINNPHVIEPNDKIWITSNEMRRITDEEADRMLAAVPEDDFFEEEVFAEEPAPASVEDEPELPVLAPLDAESAMTGEIVTLPRQHDANFAGVDDMDHAGQIVDSPSVRAFLTQGDEVYLDLGEGEVSVGDQFAIFRDIEKIRDIETRAVIGYHFDELGWLEVMRLEGESSVGVIQGARGEIERGDRMLPRVETDSQVAVLHALDDIDGAIVFTPGYRWMVGMTDSVYLNVGEIHGVEVGTQMEVYIPGTVKRGHKMPDTVVAQMVVIGVEPETSVAFVMQSVRELEIGDHVRGVGADQLAAR